MYRNNLRIETKKNIFIFIGVKDCKIYYFILVTGLGGDYEEEEEEETNKL